MAIRQNLAEPDLLRLMHRPFIKDAMRAVVQQPDADAPTVLDAAPPADLAPDER